MRTYPAMAKQRGFTLVELVTVLVILGVLAVTALPMWFNRTAFEQRGWFDELLQATRYAQKLALTTNCDVRINISGTGFGLEQPTTWCNTANWQTVALPGKPPPYNAPAGVSITAGTGTITFYASGRASTNHTVTVNGSDNFQIHATTGYVERL